MCYVFVHIFEMVIMADNSNSNAIMIIESGTFCHDDDDGMI